MRTHHFEESLENGDVVFHYRLLPGRTSTRNAIRLLEMMGYEKEISRECGKTGAGICTDRELEKLRKETERRKKRSGYYG